MLHGKGAKQLTGIDNAESPAELFCKNKEVEVATWHIKALLYQRDIARETEADFMTQNQGFDGFSST